MMDKELCFYIEGNQLYLEQILVDYNDIPIFFLCKDNKVYYLVLCTDIEELNYIIINLSDADLYSLLHGNLSMREVFIKQQFYWEVISEEQIESDLVIRKSMKEIDCSILPDEGAYFEILTDEISLYVKKFDDVFLSKERFNLLQQKSNFNENVLDENYGFSSAESVEKLRELFDCQSQQKVAISFQNIDYEEHMNDILNSNMAILEKERSEEWKSSEMNTLAYAA